MVARPLGSTVKAYHRYFSQAITLDPSLGGTPVGYIFSANGLYDPDITGVGHQPVGFDQMGQMFDHYTVIAAKIRVDFMGFDSNHYHMVGIRLDDNGAVITDSRRLIENGNVVSTIIAPGPRS